MLPKSIDNRWQANRSSSVIAGILNVSVFVCVRNQSRALESEGCLAART